MRDRGRFHEAITAYNRAIALRPDYADAHNNLGVALKDLGRFDEAITVHNRAIALRPDYAEAHNNLGVALKEQGRFDEAMDSCHHALRLKPDLAEAHDNLGSFLRDQGHLDAALFSFRRAIELNPHFSAAGSNLLLTLHSHPGYDSQAILAEHRQWAREHAEPLHAQIQPHSNDRSPDRLLRVGYISPDFRSHPVGNMLLPFFFHHDRAQFKFICYSDVLTPDPLTHKLETLVEGWHHTAGLSDAEVAGRIRTDRIDILVDLALHTAHNRILIFARKPAPIQVTMLGLPSTTGLATMDYRLTDPYLDPPGLTDGDYTEQSIRLAHCFWIFQPPENAPPVGTLPALTRGYVTFGCMNQYAKVTGSALHLWLKILQAVPGSRLALLSHSGRHLDAVRSLLQDGGIAGDRLVRIERANRLEHLAHHHDLDLGLDPFPYNGHTSTLDSLWMGVPVVTLAGRTAVGRGGVSILSNLGQRELIADAPEQYVEIAVRWARDLPGLAELRAGLRQRMQASPLTDGKQYTADVEAAFRRVWHTWCGP